MGIFFQHNAIKIQSYHVLWNQPFIFNTYDPSHNTRLKYVASVDHVHKYPTIKNLIANFKLLGQNRNTYGWLNATGLTQSEHYYIMHFTYYSQLYPVYAPDACEAVSLRMALSAKGFHIPVSTKTFINRIPRSKNPNDGYTANPYRYGDSASINPKGLIKYAKRYGAKVKNLSGCDKKTFIKNIKHGNPIVFEGAYQMRQTTSDHVLIIVGYRSGHPGQFLIADPFQRKSQNNHVFWVSTTDFMKIYRSSMRKEQALAVVGKLPKHKRNKRHKHHKHQHHIKRNIFKNLIYKHSYYKPSFISDNHKHSPISFLQRLYYNHIYKSQPHKQIVNKQSNRYYIYHKSQPTYSYYHPYYHYYYRPRVNTYQHKYTQPTYKATSSNNKFILNRNRYLESRRTTKYAR